MAPHTAPGLARHHPSERAHGLDTAIVFVQKLKMQCYAGWRLEADGPVRLHWGRAQNPLHAIGLRDGNGGPRVLVGLCPGRVGLGINRQYPHLLHLVLGQQGRSLKNIGTVEHTLLERRLAGADGRPFHPVRNDRRLGARFERQGMPDVFRAGVDQLAVSIQIHQVEAEFPGLRALYRYEEVLPPNRIRGLVRRVDARPVAASFSLLLRPVAHLGPPDFRCNLAQPIGIVHSLRRINDAERTIKPAMMPHPGKHNLTGSRNGARLHQHVGPDALIAPERRHTRAVWIHGPKRLHALLFLIRVLPAGIDNPAIRQQGWQEVGLHTSGDHVDVLTVPIAARQNWGGMGGATADIGVCTRGDKHQLAAGKENRIQVVVITKRQLSESGSIDVDFIEVK